MGGRAADPARRGQRAKSKAAKRKQVDEGEEERTLIIDINPCHRHTLVIVNLVIMLFATVLIIGSAYSLFKRWHEVMLIQDAVFLSLLVNLEIPYLVVGILAFLSSTIGFFGALRESLTLLRIYNDILFLLACIAILIGMLLVGMPFLARGSLQSIASTNLIIHYRDNEDFQGLVDYIQSNFQCCGITTRNFRDWNMNIYFNCSKENPSPERCSVPSSCCRVPGADDDTTTVATRRFCGAGVLAMTDVEAFKVVYVRNCLDTIVSTVRKNTIFLAVVVIVIVISLMLLSTLVSRLITELKLLSKVYKKYYAAVHKDLRKKLAKLEATEKVPGNYLTDHGVPAVHKVLKYVQPCRTPGTEFDRAISCTDVVPKIGVSHRERAKLLASWDCPKHNVRKYTYVYDPNCGACRRMREQHVPGTPHTPHRGHHVEHDPS